MNADKTKKSFSSRLSKNSQQGLDGINLQYALSIEGAERLCLPEETMCNDNGKTIAEISCVGGKLSAYVNAVHCIRPNNLKPLTVTEAIKLEMIKSEVIGFMRDYLKKHLQRQDSEGYVDNLMVKELECNLTLGCVNGATPSAVISLFEHALDKTTLHKQRKDKGTYNKMVASCFYKKKKEYHLKIYDKTLEQREKGNLQVEDNLLRIEIVFIDRSLKRIYGDKRSLSDILTKEAVRILCKEYRRIFEKDLIEKYLKPYLNWCKKTLYDSLDEANGKKISETIARHKEHIPDWEVFGKALHYWYQQKGKNDRTAKVLSYYRRKDMGISDGVLRTIKLFHTSC